MAAGNNKGCTHNKLTQRPCLPTGRPETGDTAEKKLITS